MKWLGQSGNDAKLQMCLVMEVKSEAIENNISNEPGVLGPWIKANWKSSNRRWQEWTSTSLGISELKCTGMGKFNSDDHYIYYCGQEYLKRNGVAPPQRVWNTVLGCSLKNNRMILVHFQGKPFNIIVIQVYAPSLMPKKLKLNGSVKTYKTF